MHLAGSFNVVSAFKNDIKIFENKTVNFTPHLTMLVQLFNFNKLIIFEIAKCLC